MKILSVPIYRDMVVYKDKIEKKPVINHKDNFKDNGIFESDIILPLHTGTHIDYPLHVIEGGKNSSDYDINGKTYKGYIFDTSDRMKNKIISLESIKDIGFQDIEAIFFKTKKQNLDYFDFEFPYLDREASKWISNFNIKFVGIDQLGIERSQPSHETHHNLLENDILIIEGLDLSDIEEGFYEFTFFTIQIKDVEAEPIIVCIMDYTK